MTILANDKLDNMNLEGNAEILRVMAHPMRLKILQELYKHKVLNVTQITQILKLPQSTVSQHLSRLRGKVIKGDRQGLEIYYSINNQKAEEIIVLLDSKQ
ncbi:hypothetical protein IKE_06349 [Bacillus cereus VD196]|uniref:HTH arsR-type domain-containing protein n=1 Tax=Bacillus cereus VD196 TaxID=1053243 RepID=A0A9W5PXI5_BACCE|nr:metalloregulator ArsR/SmtB family transcription factor [Bacillus cereus]EJR91867.1 hypothetical protein IKG_05729 [Bacillus cereus VD200]EOO57292.1 hypothetical protein IKE_06349 [Bacillus cereus VD196]